MTKHQTFKKGNYFLSNRYFTILFAGLMVTVAALFPPTGAAQSGDSEKWLGSYTFDDMARTPKRRTSSDVVPLVTYDINIEAGADGKPTATFGESGFQVSQVYECSIAATADTIEFYYERFGVPGVKDLRKFKKGDLLFTLVETRVGKTIKYLFQPAAYKILRFDKSKQKERVYFERQ